MFFKLVYDESCMSVESIKNISMYECRVEEFCEEAGK